MRHDETITQLPFAKRAPDHYKNHGTMTLVNP